MLSGPPKCGNKWPGVATLIFRRESISLSLSVKCPGHPKFCLGSLSQKGVGVERDGTTKFHNNL